jgi:hypothetical protein
MPRRRSSQSASPRGDSAAIRLGVSVAYMTGATRWSGRFWPTPGRSRMTSIPCARRCSAGRSPDSISSCGELNAPAHTMTSRRARAVTRPPSTR